jgi:hypothetical protein
MIAALCLNGVDWFYILNESLSAQRILDNLKKANEIVTTCRRKKNTLKEQKLWKDKTAGNCIEII